MQKKSLAFVLIILVFSLTFVAYALPPKVYLKVPFTPQSPFADWSQPYQDACEEANVVMAMRYIKKKGLTREEGDQELLELVRFQTGEFVVNDPGTRRGRNFRYSYKVIEKAIHDWTGDDATITQGRKAMIVVKIK